jgi:putative NIF3 family GTP cyclohydrolase 1 type 2
MDSREVYKRLEIDFELDKCYDDWSDMDFNGFISDNFKKRYMGLLLDNSNEIKQVFSAVFPSDSILNKILELNSRNNLLFTHHPMVWDLTQERVFQDINASLLPKLKAMEISIYTLHVPLDKNGEYSTTVNLARKLEIDIEGEFYIYRGVKVGIYGRTKTTTPVELNLKLTNAVGHNTKL